MQNYNENHSSVVQALLDMKSVGCSIPEIECLLKELQSDPAKQKKADKLFKSHLYPQKSINWIKYYNDIELERYISGYALQIFMAMAKNMRTLNLIQVSHNDLVIMTGLDKRTISKFLKELIAKGCIAIKIPGNRTRASVYMINPQLATVGTGDKKQLTYDFWKLTGTIEATNQKEEDKLSSIHEQFLAHTIYRNYSIGYDKQVTSQGTFIFNKINDPKVSLSTEEPDEPLDNDDDLPI